MNSFKVVHSTKPERLKQVLEKNLFKNNLKLGGKNSVNPPEMKKSIAKQVVV